MFKVFKKGKIAFVKWSIYPVYTCSHQFGFSSYAGSPLAWLQGLGSVMWKQDTKSGALPHSLLHCGNTQHLVGSSMHMEVSVFWPSTQVSKGSGLPKAWGHLWQT